MGELEEREATNRLATATQILWRSYDPRYCSLDTMEKKMRKPIAAPGADDRRGADWYYGVSVTVV